MVANGDGLTIDRRATQGGAAMIEVEVQPDGALARDALRARIRAIQAGDPVRPVTVAVPSNYAGLALRRALARPSAGERGGLLNVRFLVLTRVIELLGAPILAGRGERPLTASLREELIRSVLRDAPGVFAPVMDHPATEQRLDATFRELAELTQDERTRLADSGTQVADVVRLFDAVQALVAGRYYDNTALTVAATQAARSQHPALRDLGALVIFSPRPIARAEYAFIEALGDVAPVTVLLTASGDALADDPLREQWSDRLGEEWPTIEPTIGTHVVSAPDADEEVREALRMVIDRVEAGAPINRIALLSRNASPYAALAAAQLDAAGLPWNGAAPRTLGQTAVGRALLGLLELSVGGFTRADISAWLSAAPILRREHGGLVPAYRWDAIARSAGVVRGRIDWVARLDVYAEKLRTDLAALEYSDDPADWRRSRIESDLEEIAELRTFIEELLALVDREPTGDWASLSDWAQALLERYVGSEASLASRLPRGVEAEVEIDAYRAVVAAVMSLAGLSDLGRLTDLATFRRVLQRELDRPARRIGHYGEGLFVGRLVDAAGTDFDHVFVLGMNEGTIPTKGTDDALVPEAIWDALGATEGRPLRSRRMRNRSDERRAYLAALSSAPARTLLAPRADLRGQQGRLRSRWLLESAGRLGGQRVTNEDMEHVEATWHTVIPSFDGALDGPRTSVSLQERDLRSLRSWRGAGRVVEEHPVALQSVALREGWNAQIERRSTRFTRWDGQVASLRESLLDRVVGREQSPTSLEQWATCPRRYFFASVLRVAEREEPDRLLSISPAERGTLIHAVLERFINERHPATPESPWTSDDRARLMEIASEESSATERNGLTGAPLLWRLDRARILRDIETFADVDDAYRAHMGVVPLATELAMGGAVAVSVDVGSGTVVRLRGRIDRVDQVPGGGGTVVIDYKSGSPYPYKKLNEDPVQGGHLLQLPVYALGARAHYGEAAGVITSRYWFTKQDVSDEERFAGYEVDDAVEARFRQVLGTMVGGIGDGVFASVPGGPGRDGSYENCKWCPYDAVCSRDRAREFERKQGDKALLPFLSLALTDPDGGDGDEE
jgi:ATP-dependent helicase/nuclease subunit B